MEDLWSWIPIIVLASLFVGGLIEWFKFKTRQQELGASTGELERHVVELQEQFEQREERLLTRIQNLEAIVTSQTWDRLHADSAADSDAKRLPPDLLLDPERSDERDDAETLARLARRLRS